MKNAATDENVFTFEELKKAGFTIVSTAELRALNELARVLYCEELEKQGKHIGIQHPLYKIYCFLSDLVCREKQEPGLPNMELLKKNKNDTESTTQTNGEEESCSRCTDKEWCEKRALDAWVTSCAFFRAKDQNTLPEKKTKKSLCDSCRSPCMEKDGPTNCVYYLP